VSKIASMMLKKEIARMHVAKPVCTSDL
jgi:hypothetical protein